MCRASMFDDPLPDQEAIPLRDPNIDFSKTVYCMLRSMMEDAYTYIIKEYSNREHLTFANNVYSCHVTLCGVCVCVCCR